MSGSETWFADDAFSNIDELPVSTMTSFTTLSRVFSKAFFHLVSLSFCQAAESWYGSSVKFANPIGTVTPGLISLYFPAVCCSFRCRLATQASSMGLTGLLAGAAPIEDSPCSDLPVEISTHLDSHRKVAESVPQT